MKNIRNILLISSALAVCALPATAQSRGDWTFGLGVGSVNPKSGNGTIAGVEADIGSDEALTFTLEYFLRDNIGLELLAATPFEHGISLPGVGDATTRQLPPTLSVNYHFANDSRWTPYLGAGLNYTTFFEEETALGRLELDDSWGVAVQAGLDYELDERHALRINLRWIDIDSDATLDGANIGTAEIDPVVVNLAYVMRF